MERHFLLFKGQLAESGRQKTKENVIPRGNSAWWKTALTQKMADQKRYDFYVVFTMILCAVKLSEALITLLSDLIQVSNQRQKLG